MKIDVKGYVLLVIGLISGFSVLIVPADKKMQMGVLSFAALTLFILYAFRQNKP